MVIAHFPLEQRTYRGLISFHGWKLGEDTYLRCELDRRRRKVLRIRASEWADRRKWFIHLIKKAIC